MLQRVSYSFLHRESWAWPSVTSFRWDHVWNKPTFLHKQVYINSCRRTVCNIFALSLCPPIPRTSRNTNENCENWKSKLIFPLSLFQRLTERWINDRISQFASEPTGGMKMTPLTSSVSWKIHSGALVHCHRHFDVRYSRFCSGDVQKWSSPNAFISHESLVNFTFDWMHKN